MALTIGAITTLGSTALDALANGSGILLSAFDNDTDKYMWAAFELIVTWASNPTLGNLVDLYLIPAPDNTTYDDSVDGASEYAPPSAYFGGFPVRAITTIQRIPLGWGGMSGWKSIPTVKFKPFVINNSGFAFPASGSILKMKPWRT